MDEKKSISIVKVLVVLIALAVFSYSAYRLWIIFNNYRKSDNEYSQIRDNYTSPGAKPAPVDSAPEILPKYEDAEPPLSPDWEALRAVNSDVVGWIYVDAEPSISYPIVWREEDDDYYLHRSFEGQYLYAGAIFLEGLNNPDFSDPLSIVYGHNMKNGSMFAKLKNLLNQEVYDKNPYFWILTPNGNYRYHIFSVMETDPASNVYSLFSESGGAFLEYEKQMQKISSVKNNVPLYDDDKCVLLSTCVNDHVHRTVVLGRCVSTVQPVKTTDKPAVYTDSNKVVSVPAEAEEVESEETSLEKFVGGLFGLG